ncbi:protein REPRESSOR OF SILENCING 3 isoform X1 [Quercus robur]|uniref:protein REPRESSOR OF SILENCING 3 isoform X1 n=1 Tax=Quercus robur TaxID=38942 RepID=UPI002163A405|nr:protein REPRESSOR OF SILENCING 3 isoform X1 [Quercus robur]
MDERASLSNNMEDEEAEKASEMRIFVGGLGESVSAEDLQRMFGSLGVVERLDIVRTKSRSFAYVDFSPSSLKSLCKLFSTYNGCVWKGGRLKLEKAKEHYLVRLKREWAEQAELASRAPSNGFDANEDISSSNKPKKDLNSETKQLRIYFPSLRKVKVLPLSGSGKHKYSFRNVEVPPLPIHFCDCEEHSIDPQPAKEKQTSDLEAQSGGINEEEINIMNSVMNKLFEREKVLDAAHSGNGQAKERDNSAKLISGLQFDENEADSETDEDNLIINVVKRKNNRMDFLGVQEKERISENQDSGFSGKRTSKDGQNQNALKEQKRNTAPPNKKRKSLNEESDENGSLSAITRGKGKLKTHSDESAVLGAQLAEPESGIQQSAPVVSWSQKSSWRALVGDKSNTSFSVSHILPGIASSKEQQPNFDGSSVPDSTFSKNDNLVRHGHHLESHSSETIKEEDSQDSGFSGKRTSKDGQNQNALKEQKRNTVPPNKKRKSLNQESDENGSLSTITRGKGKLKTHSDESAVLGAQLAEPESGIQQSAPVVSWSQKSSWRALVGDKSNTSFSVSHILPGIASSKEHQPKFDGSSVPDSTVSKNDDLVRHGDHLESHSSETIKEEVTETQPAKPSAASTNSGRGAAWLQKSSWTQLISENNNSSFSLEQLLPGISYEKQVQAKPNSVDIVDSTNGEHSDLRKDDNSELPGTGSTILVTGKDVRSTPEKHQQTVVGNNEAPAPIFERKHDSAPKLTSTRNVTIGETCSFMRSAASLKEWSKTKAALSGSLKRKSGEK